GGSSGLAGSGPSSVENIGPPAACERAPDRSAPGAGAGVPGARNREGRAMMATMSDDPSPADLLRPLRRTRQYREFEPTPLDASTLDALVDVARWSGSAGNNQPWRFVVITAPATLRAIHEAGMPQTRGLATAPAAIAIVLPAADERAVADAFDDGR